MLLLKILYGNIGIRVTTFDISLQNKKQVEQCKRIIPMKQSLKVI